MALGIYSLIIRTTFICLEFAILVVAGRTLGPVGFGVYAFYFSLMKLFSIPISAGFPTLAVREVARHFALKNYPFVKGFIRKGAQLIITFWVLGAALAGVAAHFSGIALDNIALIAVGLALVYGLGNFRGGILRGLGAAAVGQLPEFVVRPVLLFTFILAAVSIGSNNLTATDLMLLHFVAATIAYLTGWILQRRVTPDAVLNCEPSSDTKQILRAVAPFSVIALIQAINTEAGIIILGSTNQSDQAGFFRIAQQVSLAAALPLVAFDIAFSPYLVHYHARGKYLLTERLIAVVNTYTLIFAILCILSVIMWGEWLLLTAFGASFSATFVPILILLAAQLVNASTAMLYAYLKMSGRASLFSASAGAAAMANIFLSLFLSVAFGAIGAACAAFASVLFLNVSLAVSAKRSSGLSVYPTIRNFKIFWRYNRQLLYLVRSS